MRRKIWLHLVAKSTGICHQKNIIRSPKMYHRRTVRKFFYFNHAIVCCRCRIPRVSQKTGFPPHFDVNIEWAMDSFKFSSLLKFHNAVECFNFFWPLGGTPAHSPDRTPGVRSDLKSARNSQYFVLQRF